MKKYFSIVFILLFISLVNAQEDENTKNTQSSIPRALAISVTIGGDFPITGSFPAYINERVDAFVTRMFNQARDRLLKNVTLMSDIQEITRKLDEYSLRGIILKRSNGDSIIVDLLKFRVSGDFKYNPYLKNDDIIIFPTSDYDRNFFTVAGAVNNAGKFPFAEGDKLSDALILAQGIDKAYANVKEVEVDRLIDSGEKMKSIKVGLSEDITLERGDRIIVLASDEGKIEYTVNVIGEVRMPGKIPITKSTTTIKEVIEKCGGFNSDADLYNAELIRGANVFKSLIFSDQFEKLRMVRMSTLIEEDSLYFSVDENLRLLRGNGLVDFNKVKLGDSTQNNFIMRDGDVVYIPPTINLVYVFGQVNNPGYIKFVPQKDYKFYIDQAEGLGQTASGDIYLIKGKSRAWYNLKDLKEGEQSVESGDFIWASKKTPRTIWYDLDQISKVATVLTGIASLVLLYYQVKK
jgi:protein involved in polysaccharide export with SLBB domain